MFGAVFSDPKRCKRLLENILNVKISRIEYPERQKVMDFSYDSKSVRLDVFVEDEKHTVYNIEMQATSDKFLPLRVRYYHDMIDLNIIDKGELYSELKRSFVIFICTYDPFGKDRYIYTFDRCCREDTDLMLDDKATSIVLNCTGHIGDISDDLKNLLNYMSGQAPQGDFTNDIAKAVAEVHSSEKWRRDFMTMNMKLMEERKEARLEGRQEGALLEKISFIRKNKNTYDEKLIISMLNIDNPLFNTISTMIDTNPDWTDEDIAEDILGFN